MGMTQPDSNPKSQAKKPQKLSRRETENEIKRILKDLAGKTDGQCQKALHKRRRSLPKFLDEVRKQYVKPKPKKKLTKQHSADALPKATTLRSWVPPSLLKKAKKGKKASK